jgi:hypothetical protein
MGVLWGRNAEEVKRDAECRASDLYLDASQRSGVDRWAGMWGAELLAQDNPGFEHSVDLRARQRGFGWAREQRDDREERTR